MAERIVIGPPRRSSLKGDGCVKRRAVGEDDGSSRTFGDAFVIHEDLDPLEESTRLAEESAALEGWDD